MNTQSENSLEAASGGPRILMAAGGTGGHITPALATAEAIQELDPTATIQFCCGRRPTELQIYRRRKLRPWVMPLAYSRRGVRARLRYLRQMIFSFGYVRERLKDNPVDVAVGFGSYLSVPPLLAARTLGVPLVLQEQNVFPGAANRWLSRLSRAVAVPDDSVQRWFKPGKVHVTGNPVPRSILKLIDRNEARAFFRLNPSRPVLLCVGGSQGAGGMNQIMLELMRRLTDEDCEAAPWQVIWSTGAGHYERIVKALDDIGVSREDHSINPFINEMAKAYAAADLVVARAGALTLAELTAVGKPSVLVPLPTSKGGHQAHNARQIEAAGAAIVIEENDPEAAQKLEQRLIDWAAHPEALDAMAARARQFGRPEAARRLAQLILEIAQTRSH